MIVNVYDERFEQYILDKCKEKEITPEQLIKQALRVYDLEDNNFLIPNPESVISKKKMLPFIEE